MGIAATEVYARYPRLYDASARQIQAKDGDPFDLPNLYASRTSAESMKLNERRSGLILIAGSGMCTGGRIKHHLQHNVSRPQTNVMIVGFQARGTIGRELVDGARSIRLWGENVEVNAAVHTIGGLSAHADQTDLARWFAAIPGSPVCALVHGEPGATQSLAERLVADGVKSVRQPSFRERIDLTRL